MLSNFCSNGMEGEVSEMLGQRNVLGRRVHLTTDDVIYSTRRKMPSSSGAVISEVDYIGVTLDSAEGFVQKSHGMDDLRFVKVDLFLGVALMQDDTENVEVMKEIMKEFKKWELYQMLYPDILNITSRDYLKFVVCEISMSKNVEEYVKKLLQLEADLVIILCNVRNRLPKKFHNHPLELAKLPVWGLVGVIVKASQQETLNQSARKIMHQCPCCRVLFLHKSLIWGFFGNDHVQRSFHQLQNWGFNLQRTLMDMSMDLSITARASENLLVESRESRETQKTILTKLNALDEKIKAMDGKIEAVDEKIEAVDEKIKAMGQDEVPRNALYGKIKAMDGKIEAMDGKIEAVDEKITKLFNHFGIQ